MRPAGDAENFAAMASTTVSIAAESAAMMSPLTVAEAPTSVGDKGRGILDGCGPQDPIRMSPERNKPPLHQG
jgi:hypothetical protein